MSVEQIWLILTFCLLAVVACYGFCKIIGDGQKNHRILAGFAWLFLCGIWFGLFAYFVTSKI